MRIAIVGDRNPRNGTHLASEAALAALGVEADWVPTPVLVDQAGLLEAYDGALISPGSPYASMDGALAAIRFTRERRIPTLGTCGGFQHILIEYARNVAGISGADHAEEHPDAEELVVAPLACSLAGQEHPVRVVPGTRAGELYAASESVEPFFCSFGLYPRYLAPLERAGLRFSGFDAGGEARILELPGHPFFLGTLFVPQANRRRSPHPLLAGLVAAAGQRAAVPAALPGHATEPSGRRTTSGRSTRA
jgi:CTP synthase (UTP-ammonia lyase)